jgi:hypothetical protein
MNSKIHIPSYGDIKLNEKDYVASGGEAKIYVKDGFAYKIYHEDKTVLNTDKIKELQKIQDKNVLTPKDILYLNNDVVGYRMEYKDKTHPLCKLFTKSFKQKNNIDNEKVVNLIERMYKSIETIHNSNCLIVDLNEMNILISNRFKIPYFIDTDSYQTPSFKATAIMNSIRDFSVKNQKWNEMSDWYSFGILTFQMFMGIHPYKGNHPNFKSNEWIKRMEMGISVFDKDAKLPPAFSNFDIIPKQYLKWFKDIFLNNARLKPPKIVDNYVIYEKESLVDINADFNIDKINEYDSKISDCFNFVGTNYIVTQNSIWRNTEKILDKDFKNKNVLIHSFDNEIYTFELEDEKLEIFNKTTLVQTIASKRISRKDKIIMSLYNDKLFKITIKKIGAKSFANIEMISNVMPNSSDLFEGVLIQDIVGKINMIMPIKDSIFIKNIEELNGYTILDAIAKENVCVVMTHKNGKYYRFIFTINENSYTYEKEESDYHELNFEILNGINILSLDEDLILFKGKNKRFIKRPPIDSSNKLYNLSNKLHYTCNKSLYKISLK